MSELAGFPYYPVAFDLHAAEVNDQQVNDLITGLPANVTDLLVMSHGWNNNEADALALYTDFFTQVQAQLSSSAPPDRAYAVLGVFWPSKRFTDAQLIPGGAASLESSAQVTALQQQLEGFRGFNSSPDLDTTLNQLIALVPELDDKPSARDTFADLARGLAPASATDGTEDAVANFRTIDSQTLMDRLSAPLFFPPVTVPGGAADLTSAAEFGEGGASNLGAFFSGGIFNAGRNLLNLVTYYTMKDRAGQIGREGLAPVLHRVAAAHPGIRIHLIGHSFGARLVTATAMALEDTLPSLHSLTLLQAAFSHYAFAQNYAQTGADGAFRSVLTSRALTGSMVVTHTPRDLAVGLAYPVASLIAGQTASAFGDESSLYGGLGRNGAQTTPEAVNSPMLDTNETYAFEVGKVYNLEASAFIAEHSDISHPQVAHALLSNTR